MISINVLCKSIATTIFLLLLILLSFVCQFQFVNNTLNVSIYDPLPIFLGSGIILCGALLFWHLEKIVKHLTS